MLVQQQQTAGKNRKFFLKAWDASKTVTMATERLGIFYTKYSKSEHTAQLCHNLVTTLSQGCHKVVTVSITKLFQACHKAATRLPQGYCGNLVTILSFPYGIFSSRVMYCPSLHSGQYCHPRTEYSPASRAIIYTSQREIWRDISRAEGE